LANAAMLVKNILFPAHSAQAMPALQETAVEARTNAGEPQGLVGSNARQPDPSFSGDTTQERYQNSLAPHFLSINIAPLAHGEDPIHRAAIATSHLASNDNRVLYGATPGHGVSLPANDAIRISANAVQSAEGHFHHLNSGTDDAGAMPAHKATGPAVHPGAVTPPFKTDNTAPVVSGPVSLRNRFINQVLVIGLADLIANASDAEGDSLSITDVTASSGTLTAIGGGWTFTPELGSTGDVIFSYAVSDGQTATPATATLALVSATAEPAPWFLQQNASPGSSIGVTGLRNDFATPVAEKIMLTQAAQAKVIEGTSGNDVIVGTSADDVIRGGNGNDILTGAAGNDAIYGEGGDDTIIATKNDGDDHYDGGVGHDTLDLTNIAPTAETYTVTAVSHTLSPPVDAQAVNVELPSQGGSALSGGATATPSGGNATTVDHTADCIIDLDAGTATGGQIGNDTVVNIENVKSGAGDDKIKGDEYDNNLDGGAGDDHIEGRDGDDTLDGGASSDVVDGGAGDDVIVATADAAADDICGGEGTDTYDASHTYADAIIDLSEGTADSTELGLDKIHDIENVKAGGGNDTIVADGQVNVMAGGDGDDTFVFHSTASIGYGEGHRDVILDFAVGDKIDLSEISKEFANALEDIYKDEALQDFVFIQNADKFAKPGQLKLVYHDDTNTTVLQGNIDFDNDVEFELELKGHVTLTGADLHHH
jgi:Ca2+-binding RTX toxin-like protein